MVHIGTGKPMVSICIPTYECGGKGIQYLQRLLATIEEQTYPRIEIVISDHSKDDKIHNFLARWILDRLLPEDQKPRLVYQQYEHKRGYAAANLNHAFKMASGFIVKPMFQDDFFHSAEAIEDMVEALENSNQQWLATACIHTDDEISRFYNPHPARWDATFNMALGHNLIGSPSVTMFKILNRTKGKTDIHIKPNLDLDDNLVFLVDCEFYYRFAREYGPPAITDQLNVAIRMRPESVGATVSPQLIEREKQYVTDKYSSHRRF